MLYVLDRKKTLLFIILTIILLLSFSVGYGLLSQNLNASGKVTVAVDTSLPVITNISSATLKKDAYEVTSTSYTDSTASFQVNLPKVNSEVTYEITIENQGGTNARFFATNATIGNTALTYTVSGIDTSTILAPNESITFTVTLHYTDEYMYTLPDDKTSSFVLEFQFVSTTRSYFANLTGEITPDSGDVSTSDYGAPFTITITNPNNFPVTYTLAGENNFLVYNSSGEEGSYYIEANTTDTFDIYIKDSDTAIAVGTNPTVNILATATDYDIVKTVVIDYVQLQLESKGKYIILADGYSVDEDADYQNPDSTSSGIFVAAELEEGNTYYFRGNVTNNYFNFGGYTWRILRLDSNGNVRLVLNDLLTDTDGSVITQSFKSTYDATSLAEAIKLVSYINDINDASVNSPLYGSIDSTDTTNLRGWYNNNLASYESYIVDSSFCIDITGGNATSSGTNSAVYYFGPYQRAGVDTAIYEPNYTCEGGILITDKVGLLSSDEYIFAGGAFRQSNTSFFLNDSGITSSWWTLSPGYYDSIQQNVGAFIVEANGSITDWPGGERITALGGIRPVITVNGNLKINGTGDFDNAYEFAE